ncbi:hypothetical protein A2961_01775 [Candidatus Woesebacteria bacterium RIFCSPLOWO2_01_FULL_39_21]|uniref:DUF2795 domain-containing protein n=1 Tax=Candidatus Woesebacteria bacterium RIFCSPLOWO2_01_FULL_39_21 TaxID=1802519 RepID=A0A1F8BD67_9BACT|nr:MAG: hypothetical protein A2691_01410 [Candidatus Woesebacteria bacterium RIFCSPHIGHO2_01_FULL_39_23]OGM61278.1 MAG: hypothetical protein A2961_01775 [Candidatus Woesebacteria bacterium RIFCSPLOWO2_01_FULL_39_21]
MPLVFYNKVLGFGKRKAVIKMQDKKNAIDHLKSHQKYPATKEEMVKECNELSDFSQEDKKWFMEKLPEGTYQSAEEVIKLLGLGQN